MKVMKGGYFMKKTLIIISLVCITLTSVNSLSTEEEIIIPNEAIRFRVIAASNSQEDQQIKQKVKQVLQEDLTTLLQESSSIEDTRTILKNNISRFEGIITRTLLQNQADSLFKVHYGLNYFPEKVYKDIVYPSGYYESLVVTLGQGTGDNWWCVLFPPLCLMEATETETSDIEYKLFVKDLIQKYFP